LKREEKETAMGVMQAMGLEDSQVLGLLVERWPGWVEQVPELALLADPAQIDAWRRTAPAHVVDRVLHGLAELAGRDGGDDRDAAQVLAWLMMPAALRLSEELTEADPDIDEHIAACLWIEVRTVASRPTARVAASLAWRLRRQVFMELGDRARIESHGDKTLARTILADDLATTSDLRVDPDDPTIREELAAVLAWASDEDLITVSDARLLVDVVAAADAWREGYPDSIPLLGDSVCDRVAARWGMSGRTVRRHARQAITTLAGAVADQGRTAVLRRIA
jgi:hypothetical protein